MQDHGGRLCEILEAGEWSSKAFMDYMDKCKIEREAMTEMIEADDCSSASESSGEEDDDFE